MDSNAHICSICSGDFNIETEGGVTGELGILPVAFCPTCFAGVCDMVDQLNGPLENEDEVRYFDLLDPSTHHIAHD